MLWSVATIAIGDIHGQRAALDDLLGRVLPLLAPGDTLVFLGDYVDRGPDARGVLERLLEVEATAPCRVVCLRGNHEQWLLATRRDPTRHSWLLGMDGLTTVESYAPDAAAALRDALRAAGPRLVTERRALPYDAFFARVPAAHLDLLERLVPACRTPDAICVHGGLDPHGGPVEAQDDHTLAWGADGFPEEYAGDLPVVYGHRGDVVLDADGWPRPRITGRAHGIDSIQHGVLTALRLPDGLVVQSARHDAGG